MKSIAEKIETLATATNYTRNGFVSADGETLIDTIHPLTGRSVCYGKSLEDVQQEYPGAFIQSVADYCAAKAVKQDSEPKDWSEITEERYDEMLNVLPPAAMKRGAFMVGEAVDHHSGTGRPRFSCFKREGGKYFALSSPITHKQFCAMFGARSTLEPMTTNRLAAIKRRAIKRQLRIAGVAIPDSIIYDLGGLRRLRLKADAIGQGLDGYSDTQFHKLRA